LNDRRQRDSERRSFADAVALGGDVAVMQIDDVASDCQRGKE